MRCSFNFASGWFVLARILVKTALWGRIPRRLNCVYALSTLNEILMNRCRFRFKKRLSWCLSNRENVKNVWNTNLIIYNKQLRLAIYLKPINLCIRYVTQERRHKNFWCCRQIKVDKNCSNIFQTSKLFYITVLQDLIKIIEGPN